MATKKLRVQKMVRFSTPTHHRNFGLPISPMVKAEWAGVGNRLQAEGDTTATAQLCTVVQESFALQRLGSHPTCELCHSAVWLCTKILLKTTGAVNFQQDPWDKFYTAVWPRAVHSCWCSPQTPSPDFSPCAVSHFYPCHSWSPISSILKPSRKLELFSMAHFYCTT